MAVWDAGSEVYFRGAAGRGLDVRASGKVSGRRIESTFEVIDYEPDRMIKATSTSGSFPITFTRMVESTDGVTKVTAIIEGDASGFFKLAQPLLARMVQRSVDGDYVNLKRVLEARE